MPNHLHVPDPAATFSPMNPFPGGDIQAEVAAAVEPAVLEEVDLGMPISLAPADFEAALPDRLHGDAEPRRAPVLVAILCLGAGAATSFAALSVVTAIVLYAWT